MPKAGRQTGSRSFVGWPTIELTLDTWMLPFRFLSGQFLVDKREREGKGTEVRPCQGMMRTELGPAGHGANAPLHHPVHFPPTVSTARTGAQSHLPQPH